MANRRTSQSGVLDKKLDAIPRSTLPSLKIVTHRWFWKEATDLDHWPALGEGPLIDIERPADVLKVWPTEPIQRLALRN